MWRCSVFLGGSHAPVPRGLVPKIMETPTCVHTVWETTTKFCMAIKLDVKFFYTVDYECGREICLLCQNCFISGLRYKFAIKWWLKDATTLQTRRCYNLWNISFHKFINLVITIFLFVNNFSFGEVLRWTDMVHAGCWSNFRIKVKSGPKKGELYALLSKPLITWSSDRRHGRSARPLELTFSQETGHTPAIQHDRYRGGRVAPCSILLCVSFTAISVWSVIKDAVRV